MPVEDISPHWVSDRVEIYADLGLTQGVGVWEIKLDQNDSAEKLADALRSFVTQYPGTKLSVSRGCLRFSWNFPAAFAAPSNFPFLPECKV